jgi:hypothetical protein
MADEGKAGKRKAGERAEKLSLSELEERVKIAELYAREAEAKVRLNSAKGQLSGHRQSRKTKKGAN